MLAVAVAQKPVDPVADEVMCLYFDELSRTDSDYLVVGVLQGTIGSSKSKEGVVVDLFPPGNDGTKNMPKEGQPVLEPTMHDCTLLHYQPRIAAPWFPPAKERLIVDMFPPGNDGTRTDSSGTGYLLPAVQMARAHARSRSGVNNIKQIALGVLNYGVDMGRYPRGRLAGGGDRDVIECEHCGASCTEPCRCNPTGFELIFGNTDDELVDMQIESDYLHLLFVTCYGMRSVTLYPMEADSNQTLVIAKGWLDWSFTIQANYVKLN